MNIPMEYWGAIAGFVIGVLLPRLKLPNFANAKQPDFRTLVQDVLLELLRGPTPAPVKVPTNEELRRRLQELLSLNNDEQAK